MNVRRLLLRLWVGAMLLAGAGPASAGKGRITVYLGSPEARELSLAGEDGGSAAFVRLEFRDVGDAPEWVGIGDLDGDGILDLTATDAGTEKVYVLRGLGGEKFDRPLVHRPGRMKPQWGAVRDMNGDGVADLVVLCSDDDSADLVLTRVFPDGLVRSRVLASFDGPVRRFTLEDLNGDGIADLAVTSLDKDVVPSLEEASFQVRLGLAESGFSEPVWSEELGSPTMVVEDFTGDGTPDLATTHWLSGTFLRPGRGDGTFSEPLRYCSAFGPFYMTGADLNRDERRDLVVSNYFSGLSLLLGNGDGTFVEPDTAEVLGRMKDSDGEYLWEGVQEFVDLMNIDHTVDTTMTVCVSWAGDYIGGPLHTGDLDADGNEDIVLGAGYTLRLFWGNGDGSADTVSVGIPFRATDFAVGDLNGDGVPDLAAAGTESPGAFDFLASSYPPSDAPQLFSHGNLTWESVSPRGDGLQYGRSGWGLNTRLVPLTGLPGRWDLWTGFGFRIYPGVDSTTVLAYGGSDVDVFRKELEWSLHTHLGLQYGSQSRWALLRPRVGAGLGLYYFGTDEKFKGDGIDISRKFNHQFRAGWRGFVGTDVMVGPEVGISLEVVYDHVFGLEQLPGGLRARNGGRYVTFVVGVSGYWYGEEDGGDAGSRPTAGHEDGGD